MLVVACSGKSAPPPAPTATSPQDAGVDGITTIGSLDPGALDRDPRNPRIAPSRTRNRPPRPIDIMLDSTPTGAIAAVDGVQVGVTPTYWYGDSDGLEHEFTFVRPRYAVARYRFVPIQSGVVHARLEPVTDEPIDAGVEPMLPPTFTPPPVPPPAVPPPPTVLAPDAGSEAPPTGVGPQP